MFSKQVHFRKRSTLIIGLVFSAIVFGITIVIPPKNSGIITLFFLCLFISLFYLFSYFLNHRRRAFLGAIIMTLYFLLRLFNLRHWSYFLVLIVISIGVELYFNREQNPPPFIRRVKRV